MVFFLLDVDSSLPDADKHLRTFFYTLKILVVDSLPDYEFSCINHEQPIISRVYL